jgi:O-methyltransferase involved in polyketide biosynthesis
MSKNSKIELGSVQETLLLPLWGRAIETQKNNPKLIDEKAVSIINTISYDFSIISKNISKISQISWIARSIYFDIKIKEFIKNYPNSTIVNIGCGLDTTFDRIDNGKIQWIDLDLPDTIALRKNYIAETDRRKFISKSVFDTSWYDKIEKKEKLMFLLAGVIYYFTETEIIFDYSSKIGIKMANKRVIDKGGIDKSAYLKWGIDNINEIEKWNSYIKIISCMPLFKEYKKKYPILKRAGMNISDKLMIMSLAHIKIN